MEGHRLILNDGTEIENGQAGLADDVLWIWVPGAFWDVADMARNANLIQTITFQYGEMEDIYEGYTVCTGIMAHGDEIAVSLVRG